MSLSEGEIEYVGILLSGNSVEHAYTRISCPEGRSSVIVPVRLAMTAKLTKICLADKLVYRELRPPSARRKLVHVNTIGFKVQDVLLYQCDWRKDD